MPRLRRDPVTWVIYAQLGVWGYFLYGFSPTIPLLRDEQRVSSGTASLHSVALAGGALLAGAIFPRLSRRFGRGVTMWAGMAGVALGVAAFCVFRPILATLPSMLCIGIAGTLLLSGEVASLGERHGAAGPAAIAEANALCCGFGALAPLAIGASVSAGHTWRPGLAVVIGLIGLVALGALIFRVRLPRGPTRESVSSDSTATGSPATDLTATGAPAGSLPLGYWLAWILMCCTGSVEVSVNLWAGDVLRHHAGMGPGPAATAVAGIVGGMCLGRLIGGRIALRVTAPRLMLGALAVSLLGFALFWLATVPALAVLGLVICGLGNAMHYPLSIGMAMRIAAGREDLAAARASYTMAIGFGVAPFLLGRIADQVGTHAAFVLVPVLLGAAALLVLPLGRRLAGAPVTASVPA